MSVPEKGFHVLICWLFCEPVELKCSSDDTIHTLIRLIESDIQQLPLRRRKLVYKRVLMEHDRTLRSYNVESGGKIYMVL